MPSLEDVGGDPGGGGLRDFLASGLLSRQVDLTSAQIKALFSSPVLLVPPQGANMIVLPVYVTCAYTHVTTAYTMANAMSVGLSTARDKFNTVLTIAKQSFIGTASMFSVDLAAGDSAITANAVNQGLYLGVATANPTLGDGTARVEVYYYRIPV